MPTFTQIPKQVSIKKFILYDFRLTSILETIHTGYDFRQIPYFLTACLEKTIVVTSNLMSNFKHKQTLPKWVISDLYFYRSLKQQVPHVYLQRWDGRPDSLATSNLNKS